MAVALALTAGTGLGWTGHPGWALLLVALGLEPWARGWRRALGLGVLALLAGVRGALSIPGSRDGVPTVGVWAPARQGGERVRGTLAPGTAPLALPRGVAAPGELLARVGPGRAVRWAAGPGSPAVPGEGPPGGGLARLELSPPALVRLAPPTPTWLPDPGPLLARCRAAALERVGHLEDPLVRGLAAALLFGDRGELPPGLADLFTRTGTRHILALSGLHVGLVAWLVAWPLGDALSALFGLRRGRPRLPPEGLRALAVLVLVPLGGGAAPVSRAALALALAALAPRLPAPALDRTGAGRRVDPLSLWALALALELGGRPGAVAEVGVQLSYACPPMLLSGSGL